MAQCVVWAFTDNEWVVQMVSSRPSSLIYGSIRASVIVSILYQNKWHGVKYILNMYN